MHRFGEDALLLGILRDGLRPIATLVLERDAPISFECLHHAVPR
jgi:hypothetical protein